jgi:hypothetical protein
MAMFDSSDDEDYLNEDNIRQRINFLYGGGVSSSSEDIEMDEDGPQADFLYGGGVSSSSEDIEMDEDGPQAGPSRPRQSHSSSSMDEEDPRNEMDYPSSDENEAVRDQAEPKGDPLAFDEERIAQDNEGKKVSFRRIHFMKHNQRFKLTGKTLLPQPLSSKILWLLV